ncbi:YdhK family protein [Paenibacillus polymyxa]|uniref:YdhK family protein n=1 Tax=Paenibacillus polymyxa TaxID=1406 RepID=UPI0002E2D134|nr:YdhK family protein [Paenibacillus polymyxa]NMP11338.1 YdhK family protein [Paenibacillus polymyxa]
MRIQWTLLAGAVMIILSGCGNSNTPAQEHTTSSSQQHDASDMNHSTSSELPAGLKEAENPAFKIGSQATIQADHMAGMKSATATVVGAYTTTAYTVSYTPTTGGEKVNNHKWVIHEEIKDASSEPYAPGTEVILAADHMKGMDGAKAIIDSAEPTTVYMVDYTPTTGGEPVKDHKWVTESELSAN